MTTINQNDKASLPELQTLNTQLKSHLKLLLSKITTFIPLNQHNNSSISITTQTNSSDKAKSNTMTDLPLDHQISIYQKSIDILKSKLSKFNLIQIESYEGTIKANEEVLHNLQSEYNIMLSQCNKNKKRINSCATLQELKTNISITSENCKELREDIRKLRQVFNLSIVRIKEQDKELMTLNDTCVLIRNNIEFQCYAPNNGVSYKGSSETDIEKLVSTINTLQKDVEIEEKSYVNEVNRQQSSINDLKNEINAMNVKMSQMQQKRRIEEIKLKEKNKYYKLNNDKSTPLLPLSNTGNGKMIRYRSVSPFTVNKQKEKENLKINKTMIENIDNSTIDNKGDSNGGKYKTNHAHINTECGNKEVKNKVVIYRKLNLDSKGEQKQKYKKVDTLPLMPMQTQLKAIDKTKKKTEIISYKIHNNTIVNHSKTPQHKHAISHNINDKRNTKV